LLMVSVGSGLYLWWPGISGILQGFTALVSDRLAAYTPSVAIAEPAPGRFSAYTPSLAIKIRHDAGMMQLVFDLHRIIGLLSAPVLLLLAFTGFHLSYPSVLETLVGSSGMAHGETGPNIISTAIPNDHPTSLNAAEFIARGPFRRAELRRVTTPIVTPASIASTCGKTAKSIRGTHSQRSGWIAGVARSKRCATLPDLPRAKIS